MNIRYKTVTIWNENDWSAAAPLYDEAFPPQGRKTARHIRRILDTLSGALHLAEDPSGETAAMAVTGNLPELGAMLIDYIAVRGTMRGRGVGRGMVEYLEKTARQNGKRAVVVEIEADPTPANERRERFWTSLGFTRTEYVHRYRWVPEPYRALYKPLREDAALPLVGEVLFRSITAFHRNIWQG